MRIWWWCFYYLEGIKGEVEIYTFFESYFDFYTDI